MPNRRAIPLALFGVLSAMAASPMQDKDGLGNIQGRIVFEGDKVPKAVIVGNIVVYLKGEGLAHKEKKERPNGVLDQRDISFVPHVLPIVVGTKVEFRNNDTIVHNIHTSSEVNPSFNVAQLPNKSTVVAFESEEIVHVGCDIHSQMSAYIVVLPNPFFIKTADDGGFKISGVPPGKYELVAWHEKYGTFSIPVQINAGQTTSADLAFPKKSSASKGGEK